MKTLIYRTFHLNFPKFQKYLATQEPYTVKTVSIRTTFILSDDSFFAVVKGFLSLLSEVQSKSFKFSLKHHHIDVLLKNTRIKSTEKAQAYKAIFGSNWSLVI